MLTRRDLGATSVAALVVLAYVANRQEWWYLGSNRWAAVTMAAVAGVGCPLGARIDQARLSAPFMALAALGVVALALTIVAIVSAADWALLGLAVVVTVLWAGATLRHGVAPHRPLVAR